MPQNTGIPIIVQGNSYNLVIPLQIYIVDDGEMVLQDFTPDVADVVKISLKCKERTYNFAPTIVGNEATITLTGHEVVGIYAIEVVIVQADGTQYRSLRTDQFVIIDSSDDLTEDEIIEGLEENVIYINPQLFIAGERGRSIVDVSLTSTAGLVDTYTITYSDGTTSTFNVTNGSGQLIIVNDLTTGGVDKALSAEMGKVIGQELSTPTTEEITATSTQTGVISRGSSAFPSTERGDIYSAAGGHSVKLYEVTAGDAIKVKFTSNDGSGLAMAWYKTNDTSSVSSSTYYYTADTYKTETASASNEYDLVVPTDVELFGVSVKDTASVVITHVVNKSRLTIAEENIAELQEDTEGITTEPLTKVNLFNAATLSLDDGNPVGVSGMLDDYIIDNTGGVLPFSPDSHNNYSGVAAFPATKGKYYVIYNPYSPVKYQGGIHVSPIVNGQFRKNNGTECVFYGEHITIAEGVWTASPTSQIQGLVFSLYYRPKTSQTRPTDFSNVEVYEVHSLPAAIEFVHSRWGETHKLKGINLEQHMLKVGGTLGSVFGQQSCVVFGDSLSADHTWSDNLAALLRLREMTNLAIGGANIHGAYNRTQKRIEDPTYHLLNPENVDLIYQILSSPTKMYDLCAKLGESRTEYINEKGEEITPEDEKEAIVYNVDNVIIMLGSNNTGSVTNNPMGDWESVKAADWTTLLPAGWDWSVLDNNTTNFDSLYAAMRYCLMLIKSRVITAEVNGVTYGVDMTNARVMWVTPPQRVNVDVVTDTQTHKDVYCLESPEVLVSNMTRIERIKRIERIIMDVCEDLSIPVLCGRTQVNVSASEEAKHVEPITINGEQRLKFLGKNLRDGVHLTAAGYQQLTKAMVRAFIGGNVPAKAREREIVSSTALAPDTYNDLGVVNSVAVTLPSSASRTDEFLFTFEVGSSWGSVTLPSGVVMADGFDWSEADTGVVFQVSIQDGVCAYLCVTPTNP